MSTRSYVIVTPAKDEEQFIENTIQSVCKQTFLPRQWVIVDDGSSDGTAAVVERYARHYDWITLVRSVRAAAPRAGGPKIVRAFYEGFKHIKQDNYDFVVKLDADLTLPDTYFEKVMQCLQDDPRIGICGGYCVNMRGGTLVPERAAEFHVRGAFKAYRKACFEAIGGIPLVWDWDGLDQMKAMYLGWKTRVLPVAVLHWRDTGSAYGKMSQKHRAGREYYRMGHGVLLGLLKTVYYARDKPLAFGAAAFFAGFLRAWICREEALVTDDLAKYIRAFQYRRASQRFKAIIRVQGRRDPEILEHKDAEEA